MSQLGRGYPYSNPCRLVPTNQNEPIQAPITTYPGTGLQDPSTQLINPMGKQFSSKQVRVITVDLTDAFFDAQYNYAGTVIWMVGQDGGDAAPLLLQLDNKQNDFLDLIYDRAISGIPFSQFWLTNPNAQPGVTIRIAIFNDTPQERIGLLG